MTGDEGAPLSIARQGLSLCRRQIFRSRRQTAMTGQLYAEFQVPSTIVHPFPVIMVHGGAQSGTNYTGTPDGREGLGATFSAPRLCRLCRRSGRTRPRRLACRSYGPVRQPDIGEAQQRFVALKRQQRWPQAELHTQWPGGDEPGDPVFDQFFSSQLPTIADFTQQQILNRDALVALVDKIGPAILLTHSQSGAFGWPVADARPDLVKALLQVEPSGPPFTRSASIMSDRRNSIASATRRGPGASPRCRSPMSAGRIAAGFGAGAAGSGRWSGPRARLAATRAGAQAAAVCRRCRSSSSPAKPPITPSTIISR